MQPKLNCILLINDRFSNFINKITIDDVGYTDDVIRINSCQEALNYLEHSIENPVVYCFPELIFLGIDNTELDATLFLNCFNELNISFPVEPIIIALTQSNDITTERDSPIIKERYPNILTKKMLQSIMDKHFSRAATQNPYSEKLLKL